MPSLKALVFVLMILPLGAHGASPREADRLTQENSLLRSEHQLAKTAVIYVLFDLRESRVLIKAKGVVLRELPLKSFTVWGAPVEPKSLRLQKKTALIEPTRKEIRPKENGEEPTSEFQALQLEDMPARFRLSLDEGVRVYVRPAFGFLPSILNAISSLKSYLVTRPLGTLWNGLHHQSYTEIALYLSETDARSLYWSFQEAFPCIIATP